MRIAILNGNPDPANLRFDGWLKSLSDLLRAKNHQVTLLTLRALDIAYCTGCWGCWVKTPGRCLNEDGSREVCRAWVNSELLLLASPLKMGFVTALLKSALDKLIPVGLPYIGTRQGECCHQPRYPKSPKLAALLEPEDGGDAGDIEITRAILERNARNFKSELRFVLTADRPVEEAADAVDRV
jgi:multimeric flavodoxin WrbA